METQHADWLRRAKADGHGGVTLPSLVRDVPDPYVMQVPIDVSGDAFTMTSRIAPDAAGATVLDYATVVGDFDGEFTPVTFTPNSTKFDALLADADADGLVELVFDILWTPTVGVQRRFLAGNHFISGKVTPGA